MTISYVTSLKMTDDINLLNSCCCCFFNREKERTHRLEKLNKSTNDLTVLANKIQQEFSECKYPQYISDTATQSLDFMKGLIGSLRAVQSRCSQVGDVTSEDFDTCGSIMNKVTNAYELIKKELSEFRYNFNVRIVFSNCSQLLWYLISGLSKVKCLSFPRKLIPHHRIYSRQF
mgnify:CR=1 FL=1